MHEPAHVTAMDNIAKQVRILERQVEGHATLVDLVVRNSDLCAQYRINSFGRLRTVWFKAPIAPPIAVRIWSAPSRKEDE